MLIIGVHRLLFMNYQSIELELIILIKNYYFIFLNKNKIKFFQIN